VRALAYLATRYGEGPINVRTVAEAEGLPAKYLEQLLARLRRGGLVRSSRGAKGGILLALPPERITVREVVERLEGSLAPVECLEPEVAADGHARECVAHDVWRALHRSVLQTLGSFTLADLAARRRAAQAPAAGVIAETLSVPALVEVGAGSSRELT
jgi:Rrf2 family protein